MYYQILPDQASHRADFIRATSYQILNDKISRITEVVIHLHSILKFFQ